MKLFSYAACSFTATVMFFGGTWRDGGLSFLMGFIVYALNIVCNKFKGLSEIECFVTSFVIATIASLLDIHVYDHQVCLYGLLFGGIVWLLPGVTITVSLLELYSKMYVYGSAKLIYGISLASQIGFGLTIGYKMVSASNSIPYSFEHGCRDPVSSAYAVILLPICAAAMGILMECHVNQLAGIILVSGVGQFSAILLEKQGVGPDAVPFICAIMITATARLYTYWEGSKRPMVYIVSGLLVLVPGGVAVRGMSNMWSNAQTGLAFTCQMLLIGVSLAIGIFISLLPSKKWMIIHVERSKSQDNLGHYEITVDNPLAKRDSFPNDI